MKKLTLLLLLALSLIANEYEEAQKRVKEGKHKEAMELFMSAAEKGDKKAQYTLGSAYFQGDGVEKDMKKSIYWLEKSAKQGFVDAQGFLGFIYSGGLGVERDIQKALFYNEKAAKQGNANAQNTLAGLYTHYPEIPVDIKKAQYWYSKAVKQDLLHAQCNFAAFLSDFWVDEYLSTYWYIQAYRGGATCAEKGLKSNCKGKELKECAFWIDDLPPIKTTSAKNKSIKKVVQSKTAIVTKIFHTPKIHLVALANDKSSIAFGDRDSIFIYDFDEMFYKIPLKGSSFLSYLKNNKKLLAVASNKLKIFNLKTGEEKEVLLQSNIQNATLSPDKNTLALVSYDKELIVLNLHDMIQERYTLPFMPKSVAYSPNGKSIAVAGESNTLRIYEQSNYFDLTIKKKTSEEIEQERLRIAQEKAKVDNIKIIFKTLVYAKTLSNLGENNISFDNYSKIMDEFDKVKGSISKREPKRKISALLFLDNENILIGGKNLFLKYNINTLEKKFYEVGEKVHFNIETMTLYPDGHTLMLGGSQNIVFDLHTEKIVDLLVDVYNILFLSNDEFVSVSKSSGESIKFWKFKK